MPKTTRGYAPQHTTASTSVDMRAARNSENRRFISLNEFESGDNDVNGRDANERNNDAAQPVDEQVALQNGQRADGVELHAAQGQRNQGDDDEGIENDGAQDGAVRAVQAHDSERRTGRERHHRHGGNDGEIFGPVVGDAERGQRAARDEQLLADFDDLDEL